MKILSSLLFLIFFFTSCSRSQPALTAKPAIAVPNSAPFKQQLGINGFEWDFSDADNSVVSPGRMAVINSFGGFRHYMDWEKIESDEGMYTFNPVHSGGWNFDMIYERCKADGIEVLSCMKNCPAWLVSSYPEGQRDGENVPAPYGSDRARPESYLKMARAAFQFAARYGHNTQIDSALLSVNPKKRWIADPVNRVRIGLGYINYMECNNEPDKNWKGPKAQQSAEQYAANLSAFYDGHLGKLGKNAGVKNADPTMKVVMGGLSVSTPDFVVKMIEWCKKNRGFKKDGSINLCFDVINYHYYSNDAKGGIAPELSAAAAKADEYVALSGRKAGGLPVWMTEAGYDINQASSQRARPIGKKSALITQADWMLRSALLYERHGLQRTFFYMLDDVEVKSTVQYSSAGFAVGHVRRPVADYFLQTKKLLGDFHFLRNNGTDPVVDIYGQGKRKIYVLYVPDQKNRTAAYQLDLAGAKKARIYTLVPGAAEMAVKDVAASSGKLSLILTETPVFVEGL